MQFETLTTGALPGNVAQPSRMMRLGGFCLAIMTLAAALAFALTPRHRLSGDRPPTQLESLIPKTFGVWREVPSPQLVVNPEVQQQLDDLYSQNVSRTYVNTNGYMVMLAVAYGGDQSRDLQVHRPEVCYSAQGYEITNLRKAQLPLGGVSVPVMRMQSFKGSRNEDVTYWVRIGETLARGNLEQGLQRLRYGLHGDIADGLLFRVSSIDDNPVKSFAAQDQFVRDLTAAMAPDARSMVLGRYAEGV